MLVRSAIILVLLVFFSGPAFAVNLFNVVSPANSTSACRFNVSYVDHSTQTFRFIQLTVFSDSNCQAVIINLLVRLPGEATIPAPFTLSCNANAFYELMVFPRHSPIPNIEDVKSIYVRPLSGISQRAGLSPIFHGGFWGVGGGCFRVTCSNASQTCISEDQVDVGM